MRLMCCSSAPSAPPPGTPPWLNARAPIHSGMLWSEMDAAFVSSGGGEARLSMRGGPWSSSLRARVERGYTRKRAVLTRRLLPAAASRGHTWRSLHTKASRSSGPPRRATGRQRRAESRHRCGQRHARRFTSIAHQISGSRVCLTCRSSAQYFHRGSGLDYVHTMEQSLPRAEGEP
jgi:hypothetical protein